MKNTYSNPYETLEDKDDFSGIAKEVIAFAQSKDIAVDPSVTRVQHMVQTDLSRVLPAQIFTLIGWVGSAVENLVSDPKAGDL